MKICKFCQAVLEDDAEFCNQCGAELTQLEEELPKDDPLEVEKLQEEKEPMAAEPDDGKIKSGNMTIVALACVLLAIIAAGVFVFLRIKQGPSNAAEEGAAFSEATAHHINAHGNPSWSVAYGTDENGARRYYYMNEAGEEIDVTYEELAQHMDDVVATCGDRTLTVRDLQYYYQEGFYTYYSYISYLMDTTAPLDSQMSTDGSGTWQQQFLLSATDMFKSVAAMCQEAEKNGFTLSEEDEEYLEQMSDLETLGVSYGFPDGDSFVQEYISPMSTAESYCRYMRENYIAIKYAEQLAQQIVITPEELEAYYAEHSEMIQGYGIEKIDKPVVNVRHILIQPESTTAEDGTSTISDEAWAAAEAEANRIYEEWKSGEATEDTFAELATTYTTDPGSAANGGLYENVYPNQMVAEFNDWCFDDARQSGDTAIVKTSYGYHVMYYVSPGDYIYWQKTCEDAMRSERASEQHTETMDQYEFVLHPEVAFIFDSTAPTIPASEEETPADSGAVTVTPEVAEPAE